MNSIEKRRQLLFSTFAPFFQATLHYSAHVTNKQRSTLLISVCNLNNCLGTSSPRKQMASWAAINWLTPFSAGSIQIALDLPAKRPLEPVLCFPTSADANKSWCSTRNFMAKGSFHGIHHIHIQAFAYHARARIISSSSPLEPFSSADQSILRRGPPQIF